MNLKSLKDFHEFSANGAIAATAISICPHGSGGRGTRAAAKSVYYCMPKLLQHDLRVCMNRNIE